VLLLAMDLGWWRRGCKEGGGRVVERNGCRDNKNMIHCCTIYNEIVFSL